MTKRILALVIAVVMLVAAFASCTPADTTKTPDKTTSSPNTAGNKTPAPATSEPAGTTPDPTDDPTDEPTETEEDIWAWCGGSDKMFAGAVYGDGFEVWPFDGDKQWAPRAFLQGTLCINKDDIDATDLIGTDEYPYKFVFYYADTTSTDSEWTGPYTTTCETAYNALPNGNIIYRPLVGSCDEGTNLLRDLEVGKEYLLVMQIVKGDEVQCFAVYNISWTEKLAELVNIYEEFWTVHDRTKGYTANDNVVLTESDKKYALDHGWESTADGPKWIGINN